MYKLDIFAGSLKGLIILLGSIYKMIEFFFQVWSSIELIPVIIVATWVLIMKLSVFIADHMGVQLPFGLPARAGKCTLKSVFWVSVLACILGLVCKCYYGIEVKKLAVLCVAYGFLIYHDYREMKNVINLIDSKKQVS